MYAAALLSNHALSIHAFLVNHSSNFAIKMLLHKKTKSLQDSALILSHSKTCPPELASNYYSVSDAL